MTPDSAEVLIISCCTQGLSPIFQTSGQEMHYPFCQTSGHYFGGAEIPAREDGYGNRSAGSGRARVPEPQP